MNDWNFPLSSHINHLPTTLPLPTFNFLILPSPSSSIVHPPEEHGHIYRESPMLCDLGLLYPKRQVSSQSASYDMKVSSSLTHEITPRENKSLDSSSLTSAPRLPLSPRRHHPSPHWYLLWGLRKLQVERPRRMVTIDPAIKSMDHLANEVQHIQQEAEAWA